MPGYFANTISN